MTEVDGAARITAMLREFKVAMLTTFSKEGIPRARPMVVATLEQPLGIWFFSKIDTEKVEELSGDDRAYVTCQRDNEAYVALNGTASVMTNPDKVRELWKESFRAWFTEGPDDPSIGLIHFNPTSGEYWNNTGLEGVRYAIEAAKAYVTGVPPKANDEQHGLVQLK